MLASEDVFHGLKINTCNWSVPCLSVQDTSVTTINSEEKSNVQPKPLETELDQTTVETERKKEMEIGWICAKEGKMARENGP